MRRGMACVLGLWLLMLTGCRTAKATAQPLGDHFTCAVEAVYRDMTVVGTLTRASAGTLTMAFTQPETLNGMSACWNGETVEITWHGLSFSMDPETVPEAALGAELIAVWDAAVRGEGERTENDGKTVIRGTGNNGEYELVCDGETGMPLTLSVPSLPLQARFSHGKIINEEG